MFRNKRKKLKKKMMKAQAGFGAGARTRLEGGTATVCAAF
jgi:hypothetical protein